MFKILALFLAISAIQLSHGLSLIQSLGCTGKDQCGANECCVITSPFIMSKRQSLLDLGSISILDFNKGTCKPFIKEGGDCSNSFFDSCGCEAGTTCVPVANETTTINGKIILVNPPGTYICKRK